MSAEQEQPATTGNNPVNEAVGQLTDHFLAHPEAAKALLIIIESQVEAADKDKIDASARAHAGVTSGWGGGSSEGIRRQVAQTEGGAKRAHEIANFIGKTIPDLETLESEATSRPDSSQG